MTSDDPDQIPDDLDGLALLLQVEAEALGRVIDEARTVQQQLYEYLERVQQLIERRTKPK